MRLLNASVGVCVVLAIAASPVSMANDVPVLAERPTFTRDVAPIFFAHCLECHRPGEVAPMSLRTYDEARPWAKSIAAKVANREMPPWFADPEHGTFRNDARLSPEQIATIVRWVDQGARRGDPGDLPEIPEFAEGWRLGEPDYIIDLPEVHVPADGSDYFPDLRFTADVPEGKWIHAVDIRPSQLDVAHHVVIFNGRIGGMGDNFNVLGVWAVGTPPNVYPEGMGRRLKPGQPLLANMHYHPNGTAVTDRTRIGLYWGEGALRQEVKSALAGSVTFSIPAGAANHEERSSWFVDNDIQIVSFFPHMHLRGKDMTFTAVYPDGREDILLRVPSYDFDWQLFYYPEEPVALPAGTRIDLLAHYDNSADNPANPDPTRDVYFGTSTDDEMMFGIFEYIETGSKHASSAEDRMAAMAATFPHEDLYRVLVGLGGPKTPSLLYLPRDGEGQWNINYSGLQLAIPVRDVAWDGDSFRSAVELRVGRMGGEFVMKGTVGEDGTLQGAIVTKDGHPFIIPPFEGTRYDQ